MTETTAQSLMKSVPEEIFEIFGDAPILSTEDAGRYHAMIAAFAQHVDPGDFITWCTIKDLTDCRTEIWRYRRMKAQTVHAGTPPPKPMSVSCAAANTFTACAGPTWSENCTAGEKTKEAARQKRNPRKPGR